MSVRATVCKKNGTTKFEVYVNIRSKLDASIRVQKLRKYSTKAAALKAEKKVIREVYEEISRREAKGTCWGRVLSLWEDEALKYGRNPVTGNNLTVKSVQTMVGLIVKWTEEWLPIPSKELNRGDGRDVLKKAEEAGLSRSSIKNIKNAINTVFLFGIQSRIIQGIHLSPVHGVPLVKTSSKPPEILSLTEIQTLLSKAKQFNHPWYVIWATALMTGMRSSELYALRKENVLFKDLLIRVSESWDWVSGTAKPTKSGYWRTAPIAGELEEVLNEALEINPDSPYVFVRHKDWKRNMQSGVIRDFCKSIGIPSVRFHTLRACFATHMLASGVDSATVMRIGGWRDFKTFQIYVRLAGINERGATKELAEVFFSKPEKETPKLVRPEKGSEVTIHSAQTLVKVC